MALTLNKLTLTRKQILAIVGGFVIVSAPGWFGWQYFEEAGAAPAAPSKPQPITAANPPAAGKAAAPADAGPARDKLIEDVLVASGLKQQLRQLPRKLMAGVRQSGRQRAKASPAVRKAIENAVTASFSAQGFHDRVSAGLKKNFDEKRMQALLRDFSAPAAKRMIELERASPSQAELAQFARSAAATPPSPQRASLIKRIDTATRASDLAIDVAFSSMKGVALGAVGGRAEQAAAVDKAIEKQRASAISNIRNATLLNLAFSFRNASDADLEEYARFYETENSKWFSGIVYTSLLEQVQSASAQAGERIGKLASKPASPAVKPVRSMADADARACLDLATNTAIIRCAEKYR
jgi:hypothetical protein